METSRPLTRRSFLGSAALLAARAPLRWLAADLSGNLLSSSWPDPARPISLGSLLKPFLALAYLETHPDAPVVQCNSCWLPGGHGRQDLVSALANSCNSYFLYLAEQLHRAALDRICLSYNLAPPQRSWDAARLIGLHEGWPQAPQRSLLAYTSLARYRGPAAVELVLRGMQRCASRGTARSLGLDCYAKTGTGSCCHSPCAPGDGYVLALYPAANPRQALLVQQHNTTGAHAAAAARTLLLR